MDETVRYTELDDTPRLGADGQPIVLNYLCDLHVDRVAGDIFDYALIYTTPNFDSKYLILFDWDAITHHQPLVRVESYINSATVPYLNHNYLGMIFNHH